MISAYEEDIYKLRAAEDKRAATEPLEWMNLAGLFYLEKGKNTFGSSEENSITLPAFPSSHCGYFLFENGQVTLHSLEDTNITIDGKTHDTNPLRTDAYKNPDLINIGSLTMKVIVRGEATLLRIWDRESPAQKQFAGFKYYPVNPIFRITAKYIPYDPPIKIRRFDIIGTEIESQFLGQAQFQINGIPCTLDAEKSAEKLLFHFTDETSNETTYGGGRKFTVPQPTENEIILDFNMAENWPCAYTPFATCPMVPQKNQLPVRVEAGEKLYA